MNELDVVKKKESEIEMGINGEGGKKASRGQSGGGLVGASNLLIFLAFPSHPLTATTLQTLPLSLLRSFVDFSKPQR